MKKLLLTMVILTTATTAFANVVIDTIVYEASNQSFEGQVAVASVIKTRMKCSAEGQQNRSYYNPINSLAG